MLSYDRALYQDYDVNRAPIHRAFGVSGYPGSRCTSRIHDGLTPHEAGSEIGGWPCSATLDEGTGGDVGVSL